MIKLNRNRVCSSATSTILFRLAFLFFCQASPGPAEIAITNTDAADEWVSTDDYIEPFLITKTAKKIKISPDGAFSLVKTNLRNGLLEIRGTFSSAGEAIDSYKPEKYGPPAGFYEESQIEALNSCSQEKCLMKLNSLLEIPQLAKAKNKNEIYQQIIFNRLKLFIKAKQLMGYENRKSNESAVKKMISLLPNLKRTPRTLRFLKEDFWSGSDSKSLSVESWLRQEIVNIAPDQMQPILRLSEIFQFAELEKKMFLEVHVYTNHYFDSSLRFYEIAPANKNEKECELTVIDVMEIDELKKTALIRAMFKGKMVKAVTTHQRQFIESIESLSKGKSALK